VVKEEVTISKKAHTEHEKVSGEVKKEELHIDRGEDQEKKKAA
jgi:stress response protein YsnF